MRIMELNLRKQSLAEFIYSADEDIICKIEKYLKDSESIPEAPIIKPYSSVIESNNIVSEPKFNSRYGHRFTQEELIATVNNAYQEAQNGECISNEEMDKKIEAWLKE